MIPSICQFHVDNFLKPMKGHSPRARGIQEYRASGGKFDTYFLSVYIARVAATVN
jgi:hypothetical protein